MLAGKAVVLGFVESISPGTIRALLYKNELKPWRHRQWCIPEMSYEFVAPGKMRWRSIIRPTTRYPTVCLNEKPVVLHADVCAGLLLSLGTSSDATMSTSAGAPPTSLSWRALGGLASRDGATHQAGLCRIAALSGRGALP